MLLKRFALAQKVDSYGQNGRVSSFNQRLIGLSTGLDFIW